MKIYVGNLSYNAQEEDLRQAFEGFGEVTSVNVITDKYSGKSKGFGFVEMAVDSDGEKAIQELNDTDLQGRNMKVNVARPKTDRNDRGGNRGGGGQGGGGFRRY